MPEACAECGAACIKTKGRYREKCPDCNQAVADARTPHVESCEEPACPVCLSYQAEQEGKV